MRASAGTAALVSVALVAAVLVSVGTPPATSAGRRPTRVWGVTLDEVTDARALARSLGALPRRPTARVVFDPGESPSSYGPAVRRIHRVADVLGQPVDSSETRSYSRSDYRARFAAYVAAFPRAVDVWEIGNEVNGEWTGTPSAVVAKTMAAYHVAAAAGKDTALTLYYNPGCADDRAHQMFVWARRQLPWTLRHRPTYVLISYYPSACHNFWPTPARWQRVFDKLHSMFPDSQLGFGEAGTTRRSATQQQRAALLRRYDRVEVHGDRFVGGGFWWSFAEDAATRHTNVWRALAADMG